MCFWKAKILKKKIPRNWSIVILFNAKDKWLSISKWYIGQSIIIPAVIDLFIHSAYIYRVPTGWGRCLIRFKGTILNKWFQNNFSPGLLLIRNHHVCFLITTVSQMMLLKILCIYNVAYSWRNLFIPRESQELARKSVQNTSINTYIIPTLTKTQIHVIVSLKMLPEELRV